LAAKRRKKQSKKGYPRIMRIDAKTKGLLKLNRSSPLMFADQTKTLNHGWTRINTDLLTTKEQSNQAKPETKKHKRGLKLEDG